MKRLFTLFLLSVLASVYFIPISGRDNIIKEEKTIDILMSLPEQVCLNTIELDPIELGISEMQNKMNEIESLTNNKDWFIAYKGVIEEYKGIINTPETIYDYFTSDEIYLIQRVVETECFDQDFYSKCNVASVIFNRIDVRGEFGDTVEEIITKPNQFAYGRKEITEDTILAVEYSFQIQDTTNGCIAFRSDKDVNNWYTWEHIFTDAAGHHYYRKEN